MLKIVELVVLFLLIVIVAKVLDDRLNHWREKRESQNRDRDK